MRNEIDLILEERNISDLSDIVKSPVVDAGFTDFHRTGDAGDENEGEEVCGMLKHDIF